MRYTISNEENGARIVNLWGFVSKPSLNSPVGVAHTVRIAPNGSASVLDNEAFGPYLPWMKAFLTSAARDAVMTWDARNHPKVPYGLCPVCKHYGDDCTGAERETFALPAPPATQEGAYV